MVKTLDWKSKVLGSMPSFFTKGYSEMVITSDFESDILGSNPSISATMGT